MSRALIFLFLFGMLACKKSEPINAIQPPPEDTSDVDTTTVDCGCTDYNAYNYSISFSCNDSTECFYPSDKAAGVYIGTYYKAVYYLNGGPEPEQSSHLDTLTLTRYNKYKIEINKAFWGLTNGFIVLANKDQDNVTLLHQGIQGTDLEGYMRNDSLYFHQWYSGDWTTNHIIFSGVKIQ